MTIGTGKSGWRRHLPWWSKGPGPISVFTSDISKDHKSSITGAEGVTPFLHTERAFGHNLIVINCITSHILNKTELFKIL